MAGEGTTRQHTSSEAAVVWLRQGMTAATGASNSTRQTPSGSGESDEARQIAPAPPPPPKRMRKNAALRSTDRPTRSTRSAAPYTFAERGQALPPHRALHHTNHAPHPAHRTTPTTHRTPRTAPLRTCRSRCRAAVRAAVLLTNTAAKSRTTLSTRSLSHDSAGSPKYSAHSARVPIMDCRLRSARARPGSASSPTKCPRRAAHGLSPSSVPAGVVAVVAGGAAEAAVAVAAAAAAARRSRRSSRSWSTSRRRSTASPPPLPPP